MYINIHADEIPRIQLHERAWHFVYKPSMPPDNEMAAAAQQPGQIHKPSG